MQGGGHIESLRERQCFCFAAEGDLAIGAKTNDVNDFLPTTMPIEVRGVVVMYYFSGCCGVVFADYPGGGKQPVHSVSGLGSTSIAQSDL